MLAEDETSITKRYPSGVIAVEARLFPVKEIANLLPVKENKK